MDPIEVLFYVILTATTSSLLAVIMTRPVCFPL